MKTIYSRTEADRGSLLQKTRQEFKEGAKIPRRKIAHIDHFFSNAHRRLGELQTSRIEKVSTFVPKSNKS